jgi:hypothetical protein
MDEIFAHIKYLNKLLRNTSNKNLSSYFPTLLQRWSHVKSYILDLALQYQYTINLPNNIHPTSFNSIRNSFKQLSSIIQVKYDSLSRSFQDKQIKKFVNQCCDDYYDNQKHMIDSFLERNKRTIIIDRVLQTKDNQQVLVTDPDEIKRLTNDHFQNCAGGHHTPRQIPDQWKPQYEPRSDINDSIYNFLMSSPSEQEWADVIQHLPLHSAAGPSGITNEMVKHLGPQMSATLRKFISGCLFLNDIPSAWREANVYPIPKPKEWECNLNNTRPSQSYGPIIE